MDGKKKYSALIFTLLAAITPVLIQEPEAQKTFMDMVPSIAAVVAGIFYIITQGGIDKEKEKAKEAQAQAAVVMANGTINGAQAQPAPAQQEIQPIADSRQSTADSRLSEPLDIKLFHERVLNDTAAKYTEQNPATVFSEAKEKGSVTTCQNLNQAKDYWDYLVTLSYDAEQYVKEATGIDKAPKGGCKVRSPEHVMAQLEVSKTVRNRDLVYTLAQTSIDWKRKLSPNDTLYHVGVLAEELLQYNT
jgi:hypothetical protein